MKSKAINGLYAFREILCKHKYFYINKAKEMIKQHFLFGSIPCQKLIQGEQITAKDMAEGSLFCYDYENTTPTELLDAYNGWGDYQAITEEKYRELETLLLN